MIGSPSGSMHDARIMSPVHSQGECKLWLISQLPNSFISTARKDYVICFVVDRLGAFFSQDVTFREIREDKVLVFVILREKC